MTVSLAAGGEDYFIGRNGLVIFEVKDEAGGGLFYFLYIVAKQQLRAVFIKKILKNSHNVFPVVGLGKHPQIFFRFQRHAVRFHPLVNPFGRKSVHGRGEEFPAAWVAVQNEP